VFSQMGGPRHRPRAGALTDDAAGMISPFHGKNTRPLVGTGRSRLATETCFAGSLAPRMASQGGAVRLGQNGRSIRLSCADKLIMLRSLVGARRNLECMTKVGRFTLSTVSLLIGFSDLALSQSRDGQHSVRICYGPGAHDPARCYTQHVTVSGDKISGKWPGKDPGITVTLAGTISASGQVKIEMRVDNARADRMDLSGTFQNGRLDAAGAFTTGRTATLDFVSNAAAGPTGGPLVGHVTEWCALYTEDRHCRWQRGHAYYYRCRAFRDCAQYGDE
jgi:hypothetical protein